MSTILKALRRLEEQKAESAPRPLRDEVVLVPTRTRSRSGLVVAVVAAIAFAALGAGLWWWLDRAPVEAAAPAASQVAVAVPAAPAPPAASPSPRPAPAVAPTPTPPPVALTAEEQAAANTMAPEYAMAAREAAERAAAEQARSAAADLEVVRPAVPAKRAPAARGLDAEPPQPVEAPITGARDAAPPAAESATDEDVATTRVAHGKSPIRVERTQWHPSPDRRVAWVEVEGVTALREVREGERVGPYVVREIEPAAVLFADGSVELRREVGR